MARFTDEQLQQKVHEGFIVESEADMTDTYKKALIIQLTVQGDTELMSAPAYWMAARMSPGNAASSRRLRRSWPCARGGSKIPGCRTHCLTWRGGLPSAATA